MATISSITFDQAAYDPGAVITATIDYVPDTPSVVATPFTLTANVTDSGGNVVATSANTFNVNTTQPGDTVQVSDTGGRAWAEGTTSTNADGSLSVPFTATA